ASAAANDGDNIEDRLTRANRERSEQGSGEVELSYGGEEDLKHHFKACQKNPGHLEFFSVDQFTIHCLPSRYQDDDLLDFIRALSNLTVRVTVTKVSDKRPKTYPGTDETYPCYSDRGNSLLRTGTGWVSGVRKRTGTKGTSGCTCRECRWSAEAERTFAYIDINTTSIVVFDDIEGVYTSCDLFFDKDTTLSECQDVITLSGMSSVKSDITSNTCLMTYVTHDMALAERLLNMCQQNQTAHKVLMDKYSNDRDSRISSSFRPGFLPEPEHSLTVIVSHPHGRSKQISVGGYTKRETIKTIWSQYTYSTATCPGSSGALVYVLGNSKLVVDHAHVGCRGSVNKLGYSSYGVD
ncbi:unnamed protein product, partial [Candidula unifasciata]